MSIQHLGVKLSAEHRENSLQNTYPNLSTPEKEKFSHSRMIDNLSVAVLIFDYSNLLLDMNTAAEHLLHTSLRQSRGLNCDDFINSDNQLTTTIQHALATNTATTEFEVPLRLTDLSTITVDCIVSPLHDENQETAFIVELIHIDRHLRIAQEENLLNQYQASFSVLKGLAHEVKNPLGGLRGAAQLLSKELTEEHLKEYTQVIINEADRLKNLVNRLLGPEKAPHKKRFNIHEAIEHVYTLTLAEIPSKIELTRDYDPSIPDVTGDPEQLIQVVLNVLGNAVEAVGTKGEILIKTRPERQCWINQSLHKLGLRIDITDNGPGVPPDISEKVFFPLITSRAEGTGLGLAIAQRIIHEHNGVIEFESTPGKTTFSLLLPLEPCNEI